MTQQHEIMYGEGDERGRGQLLTSGEAERRGRVCECGWGRGRAFYHSGETRDPITKYAHPHTHVHATKCS